MAARTLSSHEENEEEEKEEDLGSALFYCNLIRTLIKLNRHSLDLGSAPFLLESDSHPNPM